MFSTRKNLSPCRTQAFELLRGCKLCLARCGLAADERPGLRDDLGERVEDGNSDHPDDDVVDELSSSRCNLA
jgi:hypothetical protein